MTSTVQAQYAGAQPRLNLPFIIGASSVGTLIEWYDFYLYGVLAAFFARHFFPPGNESLALLASLAVFWFGFILRPFGAIFFGHLGDLIGRKFTFMLTLGMMGLATFLVGCIPSYATWGLAAPIIILLMRGMQGLALGGEYGGAATYTAEHAPQGKRGLYTSWIQTTATLGLFLSLGVILITRQLLGNDAFVSYGWRIPFLISIILVAISLYIRLSLRESPLFVYFGRLSDRIGRKPIMLAGMILAVLTYYPLYGLMASFAPAAGQLFLFPYIGYNPVALSLLVLVQVVYVTMVYGPIAAFLV